MPLRAAKIKVSKTPEMSSGFDCADLNFHGKNKLSERLQKNII